MGTSGAVRQHLHTVSGFRDNSTLGGKEKDILCPSPDVPQTSFLPVSWDSAGMAVPGEGGAFLLSLGWKQFKMAFPESPVGDLLKTLQGPEETGEERQTEGWGYLTHAVCTSSPNSATVLATCFAFK